MLLEEFGTKEASRPPAVGVIAARSVARDMTGTAGLKGSSGNPSKILLAESLKRIKHEMSWVRDPPLDVSEFLNELEALVVRYEDT